MRDNKQKRKKIERLLASDVQTTEPTKHRLTWNLKQEVHKTLDVYRQAHWKGITVNRQIRPSSAQSSSSTSSLPRCPTANHTPFLKHYLRLPSTQKNSNKIRKFSFWWDLLSIQLVSLTGWALERMIAFHYPSYPSVTYLFTLKAGLKVISGWINRPSWSDCFKVKRKLNKQSLGHSYSTFRYCDTSKSS